MMCVVAKIDGQGEQEYLPPGVDFHMSDSPVCMNILVRNDSQKCDVDTEEPGSDSARQAVNCIAKFVEISLIFDAIGNIQQQTNEKERDGACD